MAARGRKFSFMRLINNAIPNFARDDILDVDLTPTQADKLVTYQIFLPTPLYLAPLAFFWAGITDSETISQKIHRALLKHHIIAPAPTTTGSSSSTTSTSTTTDPPSSSTETNAPLSKWDDATPTVNTNAITKNFAHQVSIISVHAQRKLVGLLFFWEEECTRWKLLEQEEAEILRAMALGLEGADADAAAFGERQGYGNGDERNRDLEMALRAVEMRRRMLPSQRGEGTANVSDGVGFVLPAYD